MTERFDLHHRDARDLDAVLRQAADSDGAPFLTATVTSPPYGSLLDYGVVGQIGFDQSKADYLRDCKRIFEILFRWTKPDGVLWLVADSYLDGSPHDNGVTGLHALPFTLASLAEQVGWTLREVVVWQKDRTRPWTHRGKLRNAFEHVLLLVKGPDFKFEVSRLRDNQDLARWWVRYPERYNVFGKVPDNVWLVPIPTQGSWGSKAYQHACPLPPELVRRMLLLTTDPGDVVCDPFAGIGTVLGVAGAMERRAIGTELNYKFVDHYRRHVSGEIAKTFAKTLPSPASTGPSAKTIAALRVLKFPKVLLSMAHGLKESGWRPKTVIVDVKDVKPRDIKGSAVAEASWYFVIPDDDFASADGAQATLKELSRRPPASKFGLAGDIRVVTESEAMSVLRGREWFVYEHGRTWSSSKMTHGANVLEVPVSKLRNKHLPIAASVRLDVPAHLLGESD